MSKEKAAQQDKQSKQNVNKRVEAKEPLVETAVVSPFPALQHAHHDPRTLTPADTKTLQRTIGNQALRRLAIQRKMTLGPVGDKYEQEADAVARQVVGTLSSNGGGGETAVQRTEDEEEIQAKPLPAISTLQRQEEEEDVQMKPFRPILPNLSFLQRQEEEDIQMKSLVQRQEEEEMQMKPLPTISTLQRQEEEEVQALRDPMLAGGELSSGVETAVQSAKSGGTPIDDSIRGPMENAFGADFSNVKVHTDSTANTLNRSLSARAFTSGKDVFFRDGEYKPGNSSGQELLAHELTHVVQQSGNSVSRKLNIQKSKPTIQRKLGDDINWSTAGSIKRSGEGAEGVIFVTTSAGEIVVKFLKAGAGATQADKTLEATGFEVPESRIVQNNDLDPIGGQIRTLINNKMSTLNEVQQVQVTQQMGTYKYIQLQQKATGIALDKFNSEQVKAFIENADLIQEVGKLAAVDAFTGNTDRLNQKLTNTGNYILADGIEGPTLIAIDNEMNAKKGKNKTAREGKVRFILSDEGADSLAANFLMKLTGLGMKYKFSEEDEAFVKTNMRLGIIAGAKAVIDLMEDQPGFINQAKIMEKTELPGPDGTGVSNREIVHKTLNARLAAIKDQFVKNGWDKIKSDV